jgi:hypothetical protein
MAAVPSTGTGCLAGSVGQRLKVMKRNPALWIGVALVLILGVSFWPVHVVTVRLPRQNNRLFWAGCVGGDDFIKLTYRHSVELTRVEGWFQVAPRRGFVVVKTRMESVGTGLPNAFPERTTRSGRWLVVDEKRQPLDAIRFFIVPINQTRLFIGARPVDLASLEPGTLITLNACRRSLFICMWHRLRSAMYPFR